MVWTNRRPGSQSCRQASRLQSGRDAETSGASDGHDGPGDISGPFDTLCVAFMHSPLFLPEHGAADPHLNK